MPRQNQPVRSLRSGSAYVGARVPARAEGDGSKLAAIDSETAEKRPLRIRVCLQAYRKPPNIISALAAAVGRANPGPSPALTRKWATNLPPKDHKLVSSQPLRHRLRSTEAAALIEFAVALPLLVVLIVGIFDFGGAFNLKQELSNAVREGARFAAAQPSNDLPLNKPPSVDAVRFLVDSYLQTARINDCGLRTAPQPGTGGGLTWVYTATGGGCTLTLTINRGASVQTSSTPAVQILCTTVSITYPYQWHFNSVIQLLVPGANYTFTDLHSDATAVNMD